MFRAPELLAAASPSVPPADSVEAPSTSTYEDGNRRPPVGEQHSVDGAGPDRHQITPLPGHLQTELPRCPRPGDSSSVTPAGGQRRPGGLRVRRTASLCVAAESSAE